jgi:site-specific DNA-methyltransferase (adenine-specific)
VPSTPPTKAKTGAGFIMPPQSTGSGFDANIGRWPANVIFDEEAALLLGEPSRFFYTAKASKVEREAGLYYEEWVKAASMDANIGNVMQLGQASLDNNHKSIQPRANHHPTVKPLALMRYLVRLVTPPGGTVLDPFMGSGSTGCAAVLEGCDFVGIDITPEYVAIAQKRIDYYAAISPLEGI